MILATGATFGVAPGTSFTGTLQAPAAGAAITLAKVNATSASVVNGALVITTATGTITIAETGLTSGAMFAISSDDAGAG